MRINCNPVELLADAHLRAEFREIIMSIHYYKRSSRSPKGIINSKISERYTLGGGHGYMWYNKFEYIKKRYQMLLEEMKVRDFETSGIESKFIIDFERYIPESIRLDWNPSIDDKLLNLERILNRIYKKIIIQNKPSFYKYYGKEMQFLDWCILYTEEMNISQEDMFNIISKIEAGKSI